MDGRDPGLTHLCPSCRHVRHVTSGRGSTFERCARAAVDGRYVKYPSIPVARCEGFEAVERAGS